MKLLEIIKKDHKKEQHLEIFALMNHFIQTKQKSYLETKYVTITKVENGTKAKENLSNAEGIFADIVLKILNENSTIKVLYMHENIKKFMKAYSEKIPITKKLEVSKYRVDAINERLHVYELDFATDQLAYYKTKEGHRMVVRLKDNSVITSIELFLLVYLVDSLKEIKKGSEKLLYGNIETYKKEFADEL